MIQPYFRVSCSTHSPSNNAKINRCLMNQPPPQTKTPKSRKNQLKAPQHTPSDPAQQFSPQSLERYLPIHSPQNKHELPLPSESHVSTIFRKHQYEGKEFTEIHDLRTGVKAVRSKAPIKYTLSDFNEVAQIGSCLVNVSALNAEQTYKKTEWKELYKGDKFCKCTKSECLKNYCSCHQKKIFCTSDCLCLGCKNRSRNEIHFSVEEQQRIRSRQKMQKQQIREGSKRLQQNDLGLTNVYACKRSKSCKKYQCGCYRAGINCSSQCGCSDCKN